jgi:MraZ protein
VFSGSQAVTIDEKGRIAIPAKLRAQIIDLAQGRLVVATDPEGIKLYPQPEFERIAKEVIPNHPDVAQRRILKMRMIGGAVQLEMDSQGRMVLPLDVRKNLGTEAVLIGQVAHLVLMSASEWDSFKTDTDPDYRAAYAALDL